MRAAVMVYRNGQLEANEEHNEWIVRLANLEARASYLDLALAELLGNAPEAHRVAARLLSELTELTEQQDARLLDHASRSRRCEPPATGRQRPMKPLVLSLRVLLFAIVSTTAFILTTWLTALR